MTINLVPMLPSESSGLPGGLKADHFIPLYLAFLPVGDDEYAIAERYKVIDIPITYLLDKNGIISTVTKGAVDWQSGEKLASIEALL